MKRLTPRDKILRERGLSEHQPAVRKHKRFLPSMVSTTIAGRSKTPLMRYLEQRYGLAIEKVLLSGSLSVVAKKLGNEVDVTTLSKWIKRFNLRYHKDNLPICEGCKSFGPACTVGVCYVLIALELYDLVPIKKKEMLDEGT